MLLLGVTMVLVAHVVAMVLVAHGWIHVVATGGRLEQITIR